MSGVSKKQATASVRNLIVVLGDQLDRESAALKMGDPKQDRIWMAEVQAESTVVWSHKVRSCLFLSAMRHFRNSLLEEGWPVDYVQMDQADNQQELGSELAKALQRWRPQSVQVVQPGEYRVQQELLEAAAGEGYQLEILTDDHFYETPEFFRQHAQGRKELRLEYFYRELRKRHGVLMDGDQPEGGSWNYDQKNRGSFGKAGPPDHPAPLSFPADDITQDVMRIIDQRLKDHPGDLSTFDWPVTTQQAEQALQDFVQHRLAEFGQYQDAMWEGRGDDPYLFHSRLSAAMNLKLLNPRIVVNAAVEAYHEGKAPLEAVEGFVRQILGWREYVRGIYWMTMPQYLERNAMDACQPLPDFYWTGETEYHCLSHSLKQTLRYGYAHHIQRLMVTGLFGLLLGVDPVQMHRWYLAVYVDAVEWVELPNTLGMSQYADGGLMASKPYVATGKYIDRMSNYCKSCPKDPGQKTGQHACPFTVLYWDYLLRHRSALETNARMKLQVRNLDRIDEEETKQIQKQAQDIREAFA